LPSYFLFSAPIASSAAKQPPGLCAKMTARPSEAEGWIMRRLALIAGLLILASGCQDKATPPAAPPDLVENLIAGREAFDRGDFDQALVLLNKPAANDGCRKSADYFIGRIHELRGNYDEALTAYQAAIDLPLDMNSGGGVYPELTAMARIHTARGDLAEAEELLERATNNIWALFSRHSEPSIDSGFANISLALGDLAAAEGTARAALAEQDRRYIDDDYAEWFEDCIPLDRTLGHICLSRGDTVQAREWFSKAYDFSDKYIGRHATALDYANLALVALAAGDMDLAESHNDEALAICEEFGLKPSLAKCYVIRGMIARSRHDYAATRDWYTKAADLFNIMGCNVDAERLREFLSRLEADPMSDYDSRKLRSDKAESNSDPE